MEENRSVMLSKKDVAELLGVTTRTIERLAKRGAFPVYRIGNRMKAKKQDVLEYLESQKQTFQGEQS